MSDAPKITPADAGCWLDGSQGWHNNYHVIDRALDWGWAPKDITRADLDTLTMFYASGNVDATYALSDGSTGDYEGATYWITGQGELSDQATEYLQGIAPEGYVFVWDDGLALMPESEASDLGHMG
jgi:hypothetical protein